jgi:hypothetical protein
MDMLTDSRVMLELEAESEPDADWLTEFFERASRRAGQMRCGITGHNVLLRYTPTRLSLQCASCGYESPGWEIEPDRRAPRRSSARVGRPVAA